MSSSSLLASPVSDTQWGTRRIALEPFIVCHAIFSWLRAFHPIAKFHCCRDAALDQALGTQRTAIGAPNSPQVILSDTQNPTTRCALVLFRTARPSNIWSGCIRQAHWWICRISFAARDGLPNSMFLLIAIKFAFARLTLLQEAQFLYLAIADCDCILMAKKKKQYRANCMYSHQALIRSFFYGDQCRRSWKMDPRGDKK